MPSPGEDVLDARVFVEVPRELVRGLRALGRQVHVKGADALHERGLGQAIPFLAEREKQRTSAVMSAHGHRHARALTSRCRSTAFPPRARGSSRPPLSTPSSCSDSHAGAVFSGLKRLRIFGERRSPLEISRRREESRVRVSDSSICDDGSLKKGNVHVQ